MADQPTEEQKKAIQEKLQAMSPEQIKELIKQQCIFCKIVGGEVPAKKIYEDAEFLAFLDIQPYNPGHTLVIPKEHHAVVPQMSDTEAGNYMVVIKKLISALHQSLNAVRINVLRLGEDVPHVHFHLVPRFENDEIPTMKNLDVPVKLSHKQLPEEQMNEIQNRIVAKLAETKTNETEVTNISTQTDIVLPEKHA